MSRPTTVTYRPGVHAVRLFASFDPRVDGLPGAINSVWSATDCPISMTKIGPEDTGWCLDARSSFALCTTEAQINALYRGLARQPALDFTPTHLLTPDPDNDRFTDTAGDHLTKEGLGDGATIKRSPLFDERSGAGYQAEQLTGNASYYVCNDGTKYDFGTDPYVVAYLASYTQNAGGGISMGKWQAGVAAPYDGVGWAVSLNAYGGFGFLINGEGVEQGEPTTWLNADTPYGAPGVDDGRIRIFHHGRSLTGAGKGYVRTANIAAVEQVGEVDGSISNTDTVFGLVQHGGVGAGTKIASGNQQVQRIAVWEGDAAENVTAYLDLIEGALQAQLGGARQELIKPAVLQDFTVQTPVRALDVAFLPNTLRPTWLTYSVKMLINGNGGGGVQLISDAANPPTTLRAEIHRTIQAGAFPDFATSQLVYLCPPNEYVLLKKIDTDEGPDTPTITIVAQAEVTIP